MEVAEYVHVILLFCVCGDCMSDYYSVLGIPQSASEREIKKAFHQLALRLHPDKNHSPNAQQIFTHLVQAYEVLSSQEKRRLYDQEHSLNQCSKEEGKQDLMCSLPTYKDGLYSNNDFLTFSLEDLEMLHMEEDVFMAEEWSLTSWGEGYDEEDTLDMFGLL